MNTDQKNKIHNALLNYIDRFDSQAQAAYTLQGVSAATVSQVVNKKWNDISESMWRTIASQIGYVENQWKSVATRDYVRLTKLLSDAQEYSNVLGITGDAGTGKTHTLKKYASENKRAYLLCCNEYWNRNDFLRELLRVMGKDHNGLTMSEMMNEVVLTLKSQANPLIIMDEADKLADKVLYFFITIYNALEDHCGIMLIATSHLSKRIERGVKFNRRGCAEIFSRIGGKFVRLLGASYECVSMLCEANGVINKSMIKKVWEDCNGDLRRVKRKVHAIKMIEKEQQNSN